MSDGADNQFRLRLLRAEGQGDELFGAVLQSYKSRGHAAMFPKPGLVFFADSHGMQRFKEWLIDSRGRRDIYQTHDFVRWALGVVCQWPGTSMRDHNYPTAAQVGEWFRRFFDARSFGDATLALRALYYTVGPDRAPSQDEISATKVSLLRLAKRDIAPREIFAQLE